MRSMVLLLLVIVSFNVSANSSFGVKKVEQLIFHDSGNLYVIFSGEDIHSETCDAKHIYVLPKENGFFDQIYSGLLAAMHSGSDVTGWVNGCVTVWGKTLTKITRVDLLPQNNVN